MHGRGVFTLNDLIEKRKLGRPQRGGKREIIIDKEDDDGYR